MIAYKEPYVAMANSDPLHIAQFVGAVDPEYIVTAPIGANPEYEVSTAIVADEPSAGVCVTEIPVPAVTPDM